MYIFCYKEPQLLVTRICHGDAQELQKSKSKHISGGQEAAKLGSIEHGTNVGEGAGRPSVGSTGTDGQGALRPRRSQQKFFHFPQHQRLFPSESRDASQRTRLSAESPPGDSVGFFYGLTPPDNQSAALSSSVGSVCMGSSPYGTSPMSSFTPGCSPPVGSAPKSFPHFQHPSHALLEANGFKQQKYARYFKRCLTERKHLGIGCSEVRLHSVLCYSFKVIMSCSVEVSLLSKGTS
jgi:la-related protein 1